MTPSRLRHRPSRFLSRLGYVCLLTLSACGDSEAGPSPCAAIPCEHGGTCTADGDSFTCLCPSGWSGSRCEIAAGCSQEPCGPGTCTEEPGGGFRCDCPDASYDDGRTCTPCAPIEGCAELRCTTANDATCVVCTEGFELSAGACRDIDDCAADPCGDGVCTDLGANDYACSCDAGDYDDGTTCVSCTPLSGCDDWVCTSATDSTCVTCSLGHSDNGAGGCQPDGGCSLSPCGHGECVETGGLYRCDCPAGEFDDGTTCAACAPVADCDQVACSASDDARCVSCASGFGVDAAGGCVDLDDCVPNPCPDARCRDLGPNVYECEPLDVVDADTGGTASIDTDVGAVTLTAPPDVFADTEGTPISGDVRVIVRLDGFAGSYLTNGGTMLWPSVIADVSLVDAFGNPVTIASGRTVTLTLPLPSDPDRAPGQTLPLYYYHDDTERWRVETTGTVVAHAGGLGVQGAVGHFTWYAAGETCQAMAQCDLLDCETGRCAQCASGFAVNPSGMCANVDDCVGHLCGSGACIDGVAGYTCDCPVGTWGDGTTACTTCTSSGIVGCTAESCSGPTQATCTACASGYTLSGGTCVDVDDCRSKPCGAGTCTDRGPNDWSCDCPDGAFGDGTRSCTACNPSPVTGCTAVSCTAAGASTCTACAAGYQLRNESCFDLDDCVSHGCGTGTCIDGVSTYTCDCPDGTFGDGSKSCTACSPSSMTGCTAVTCTRAGTSTCVACASGYALNGGTCVNNNDCASHQCGAGTCLDGLNAYTCDCPDGTYGDGTTACTACSPGPAAGCTAVTCSGAGSSTCVACAPGYSLEGASCADINDCASNPCGAGTCTDTGANSFTCDCPDGSYGDGTTSCSSCAPIEGCTTLTCTGPGASTCTACAPGYTLSGATCQNADNCPGHTCGAGTCVDGVNDYTCNCPDGMFGDGTKSCASCDAVANCTAVTCTSAADEACKTCATGFEPNGTGGCRDHDDCTPNPCNGGTCTDLGVNAHDCGACPAGRYDDGTTCASCDPIANCAAVTCSSASNETCATCAAGFAPNGAGGCKDADDCSPNPCGLSTCTDIGTLSYTCTGCASSLDCTAERPVCQNTGDGTVCIEGIFECVGDDAFEHHDDGPLGANPIALGTPAVARICGENGTASGAELDWYTFDLATPTDVEVTLTWAEAGVDLDVYLVDATLDSVRGGGATGWARPERIRVVDLAPGTYYVAVSGWAGTGDDAVGYSLEIGSFTAECRQDSDCTTEGLPACGLNRYECVACNDERDCPASAPVCTNGSGEPACTIMDWCNDDDAREHADDGPNGATVVSLPTSPISGRVCGDGASPSRLEADWFMVSLAAQQQLEIELSWTEASADLDLYIVDLGAWMILASAATNASPERLTFVAPGDGDYYINVSSFTGAPVDAIDYLLTLETASGVCQPNPCNGGVCTETGPDTWDCSACPSGKYDDGTTCASCDTITNCTAVTCTSAADETCATCATGYEPNGSGGCQDHNDCIPNPCSGGTCTDTGVNSYDCFACPSGKYDDGTTCATCDAIDNCTAVTCTSAADETCATCATGHEPNGSGGCQDHNDCIPNPCNGGTCTDTGVNSYDCSNCPAGKYDNGTTCATCDPIANCHAVTCTSAANETCTTCAAGYDPNGSGGCVDHFDCNPNPCNGGTCTDTGVNSYDCSACPAGKFDNGTTCGNCDSIANCSAVTCTSASNETCATCATGYDPNGSGGCVDHYDCNPNPCNGGTCTDTGVNSYDCSACPAGKFDNGTICVTCDTISSCISVTCTSAANETCATCTTGYEPNGTGGCKDINDCNPNPCNGGTCTDNGVNNYDCAACPSGTYDNGTTCATCDAITNCAAVTCSSASNETCATCAAGFAPNGAGGCMDADDCSPNPCGLSTCTDTGTLSYTCSDCASSLDCTAERPVCQNSGDGTVCIEGISECVGDDAFEHHDDGPLGANPIALGTPAFARTCGENGTASGAELDWYTFELAAPTDVEVTLTWAEAGVDLDIYLVDATLATVREGGATGLARPERIRVLDLAPGTYYLAVSSYAGTGDDAVEYSLEVASFTAECTQDSDCTTDGLSACEPTRYECVACNDDRDCPSFAPVCTKGSGEPACTIMDWCNGDDGREHADDGPSGATVVSLPMPPISGRVCGDGAAPSRLEADWFMVSLAAQQQLEIELSWTEASADLDLYIVDLGAWMILASAATNASPERLTFVAPGDGDYHINVSSFAGAPVDAIEYLLTIETPSNACQPNPCNGGICSETGPGTWDCSACPSGRYDNDTTCATCDPIANCAAVTCTSAADETCATCATGYEPNGTGGCKDIDDCSPNPCENGGICDDVGVDAYTCTCPPGTSGLRCEVVASTCDVDFDCPGTRPACLADNTCGIVDACADDDAREHADDGPAGASVIAPSFEPVQARICDEPSGRESDWYEVALEAAAEVTITVAWSEVGVDLDFMVLDADGTAVGVAVGQVEPEVLVISEVPATGRHYIVVQSYDGALDVAIPYSLSVEARCAGCCPAGTLDVHGDGGTCETAKDLAVGSAHVCAIMDDGALYCWGDNAHGQLGDGTDTSRANPTRVGTWSDWADVEVGSRHSCGLRNGGELYCWGDGQHGRLGDGDYTEQWSPVRVGEASGWSSVSAGGSHTCGRRAGRIYCWGDNSHGQLGDGTTTGSNIPVQVGDAEDWGSVDAGGYATCGLRGGELYCWGYVSSGDDGSGGFTLIATPSPVRVGSDSDWITISAGGTSYGVRDGELYRMSNLDPSPNPVRVDTSSDWSTVTAGDGRPCGIRGEALYCWGRGPVGDGAGPGTSQVTPVRVGGTSDWERVEGGGGQRCGLRSGRIFCWGENDSGQLGQGVFADESVPSPVGAATDWSMIAMGRWHSCGLRAGALYCWGDNTYGGLGDGTTDLRTDPGRVGVAGDWSQVAAGGYHTCGLRGGALYCWGYGYGALGIDNNAYRTTPIRIGGDSDWSEVTAGEVHTCGRRGGTLWCWGWNTFGSLGIGGTNPAAAPVEVGPGSAWSKVSAGGYGTCGRRGGELYCWGSNESGQLGIGSTTSSDVPVRVGQETDWTDIEVGTSHSCGRRGGSLYCWGSNFKGRLGIGDEVDRLVPQLVGSSTNWLAVAAGGRHSCGTESGNLYCWGDGIGLEAVDGVIPSSTVPLLIDAGGGWSSVDGGFDHTCALRNGALYCWGWNLRGQLGIGDTWTPRPVEFVGTGP